MEVKQNNNQVQKEQTTEEKVREVFAQLDIDGNGFIEKGELTIFLKNTLGEYYQAEFVEEFLV